VTADGKYAFVAGRNSQKIIEVDANPLAGGNIGIIKDPLGPHPQLVAATEQVPGSLTNNVTLSSDGKYLIGSYPTLSGGGSAYVFDVGEIIKTVENPGDYWIDGYYRGRGNLNFQPQSQRRATLDDLARVPIEELNPLILPQNTTPAIPNVVATGGNPLGLAVAQKNVKAPVPVSKMSFVEKLKAAIELVPDMLVGDAKAAFQQLVSNPEFIAELVAVGVVFAALQAVPVLGQAIDAAFILALGFSTGFNLGSFFLNVFNAEDKQGLQTAANDFKNVVISVAGLALIGVLRLVGRLLRSIRGGGTLTQALKFPLDVKTPPNVILESAQPALLESKVSNIPGLMQSMLNGEQIPPIGGFRDGSRYIILEGNHRMAAALELYKQTGDLQYVQRLLDQGRWTPFAPGYINRTYSMTR
jgi:hypothetical protein